MNSVVKMRKSRTNDKIRQFRSVSPIEEAIKEYEVAVNQQVISLINQRKEDLLRTLDSKLPQLESSIDVRREQILESEDGTKLHAHVRHIRQLANRLEVIAKATDKK